MSLRTRKDVAEAIRKQLVDSLPFTVEKLGISREKLSVALNGLLDDRVIQCYLNCHHQCGRLASLGDVDIVLKGCPSTFDEFWNTFQSFVVARTVVEWAACWTPEREREEKARANI